MKNRTRRQLMHTQRAAGLSLIAISFLVIFMASKGTSPIDQDITPVLFTLPWGLWWTLSRKIHIDM